MRTADRRDFEADPGEVRRAREFVGKVLDRWGLSAVLADGMLIATELATNAVVHARSRFSVSLERIRGGVVIAVSDEDPRAPLLELDTINANGGRGMNLVKVLSKACGVRRVRDGKTVWAALSTKI